MFLYEFQLYFNILQKIRVFSFLKAIFTLTFFAFIKFIDYKTTNLKIIVKNIKS